MNRCAAAFAGLLSVAPLGCAQRDADASMVKAPSASSPVPVKAAVSSSPPLRADGVPADGAEAKRVLLDFRNKTPKELDAAVRAADKLDPPERFEERGVMEGKPYYMSKSTYPHLKIVVHSDGTAITNVVEIK